MRALCSIRRVVLNARMLLGLAPAAWVPCALAPAAALLLCAPGPALAQELDVLIDGNGEGLYGLPGTGAGGFAEAYGTSPDTVELTLEIRNYYGKANKYRISWNQIPGLIATAGGSPSPYTTPNIDPGASFFTTFQVIVPPGSVPGTFQYIVDVSAVKFKKKPFESVTARVRVAAQLSGVIRGIVFDDCDHDGAWSAGDAGMSGVLVGEDALGTSGLTDGSGWFSLIAPAGVPVRVFERNPSGFLSLSPDTLGPFVLNAGDTIDLRFADVPPLALSPGTALVGLAGGYVDFPHSVRAGTRGQATITTSGGAGGVIMLFLDADGNGMFDDGDRTLEPADCLLDPQSGTAAVNILVRLFIPIEIQPGETVSLRIDAAQQIEGTPFEFTAAAHDVAVIVGPAAGRLSLGKETDRASAVPGDVITYTIEFFNAGTDTIRNVVLLDPVSDFVDVMPGGFGPGMDVAWSLPERPAAYLTFDPADGDECEFSPTERLMRIIFSKNAPVYIPPGERGRIVYRVTVR